MIFGVGCDIVKISRFEKWVESEESYIGRFFNEKERIQTEACMHRKCEFYAGRFAAKEAFSKALGTGISGFNLRDVYVCPDDRGRPVFVTEGSAKTLAEKLCGNGFRVHISISHEKEYAVAYAVIEI